MKDLALAFSMQGEAGVSGSPGPSVRNKQVAVLLCSWSLDASNTSPYWLNSGHLTMVMSPWREASLTPSCIISLHLTKTRDSMKNIYILLDVLLCSIAEYLYELCRILASP